MTASTPPPSRPPPAPGVGAPWRSQLWRKQALVMALLAVVCVAFFGAAEMLVTFSAARQQAGQVQLAQAREAAQAIRSALLYVERHVQAVNDLPWGLHPELDLAARREEFARLLRLVPAAQSVTLQAASGQELLFVSRRSMDRAEAPPTDLATPAPGAAPVRRFSSIEYADGHDPVVKLGLRPPPPAPPLATVVDLGLRTLARDLGPVLQGPGRQIYAVDAQGTVVLHHDAGLMLARTRVPVPQQALDLGAEAGTGLRGQEVLRAVVQIPELGWRVIVEQPRQAVMAPVWATLQRTALFGALGIATALVSALVLANRLTLPLRQLHHAVGQVASGQLDTVIAVQGRGELAELATQFNHMAQGLRSSYAELEDRIAAKTMDLQRANRHKSEFLANMSHELRTPLNAILGFADILSAEMAGPLSDEQREYVADIHASGLHLLALINDVLDVSRIEAGQLALERSEFDVAEVVEAAATLVRQRALHKGVALHIETAPEVSTWVADARRFKQVVLNLLNNAVKFTPEGGHIHVRTGANAAEGLWVEVQDSGIGIAPADHAAVFEEFRQVGDAAGRAEGSGLGLALAQRLVAQHGGRVTLTSALGAGASFRFNIPRREVGDPP
jgi:signal transduction histidine kinase